MTDREKLTEIIDEIDPLILSGCTYGDISFMVWRDKARLFLAKKYGETSDEYKSFKIIKYYYKYYGEISGNLPSKDQVEKCRVEKCRLGLNRAKSLLSEFLEEIPDTSKTNQGGVNDSRISSQKVFIVHGHNGELKEAVARFVEKHGVDAIILSEQASQGKTFIEMIESNSDVGGAICLFTADDLGRSEDSDTDRSRARQNVVFETGYFIGKHGRDHIVILRDDGVEMPSDLSSVATTSTGNWETKLLKELKTMGYKID